jgi:hypothetical protein
MCRSCSLLPWNCRFCLGEAKNDDLLAWPGSFQITDDTDNRRMISFKARSQKQGRTNLMGKVGDRQISDSDSDNLVKVCFPSKSLVLAPFFVLIYCLSLLASRRCAGLGRGLLLGRSGRGSERVQIASRPCTLDLSRQRCLFGLLSDIVKPTTDDPFPWLTWGSPMTSSLPHHSWSSLVGCVLHDSLMPSHYRWYTASHPCPKLSYPLIPIPTEQRI